MKVFMFFSIFAFGIACFLINREKLTSKYKMIMIKNKDLSNYINKTMEQLDDLCAKSKTCDKYLRGNKINETLGTERGHTTTSVPKVTTTYASEKKSNICLVTAFKKPHTKEYFKYSDYKKIIPYTISNMWSYAKQHDYKLFLYNEDVYDISRKSSWVKIPLFRKYFNKGCDWVFYTDIDWLFLSNKPLPIDDEYDIILSNECIKGNSWKKMSGTLLLKNSEWSKTFLHEWDALYSKYKDISNHDQTAFEEMMKITPKEMKVLPPEEFMTYDTHNCVQPEFGIHFPAGDKYKRIKKYFPLDTKLSVTISNTVVNYHIPYSMASADIVIGVLSSDKSKRMVMRNKYTNIFFIVGKKNGKFDYDEFYEFNDLIFIDMEEAYMGEKSILPYKTQVFLHAVETHVDSYDYILKLDDDSLVKMELLTEELQKVKPEYWGRVWYNNIIDRNPKSKWYVSKSTFPDSKYPNYCSGAGYVLSRKANKCIVTKLENMKFMPREDVATGILAGKCGFSPVNSNKIQHMKPYAGSDYIIRHYYDFNTNTKIDKEVDLNIKTKKDKEILRLTPKGNFMFGYYDQLQDNVDSTKILVAKIPFFNREPNEEDSVEIGWVHSDGDQVFHQIGTSYAWNLQTGAMAEWIGTNKVVYNDRRNNNFVAVIKNIVTGEETVHPRARFCGKDKFISISFSRLHNLRRGYGYTVPLKNTLEKIPDNDGIWIDNKLVLSYKTLVDFIKETDGVDKYTNLNHPNGYKDNMYWWVNHVMKSRVTNRISFILRATTQLHGHSYQFSSLMMYDYTDGLWRVPLRGSHPYFGSYLINCEDSGAYKIKYKESIEKMNWQTDGDGHCSLSSDEKYILSDTYPRPKKKLFITNLEKNEKTHFGQYSPSQEGPIFTRCDLHPKMSRNMKFITFDSTHEGFRGVYKAVTRLEPVKNVCERIFIDMGANIGMHSRFIFEEKLYPSKEGDALNKMFKLFEQYLGSQAQRRSNVCVFGFEANKRRCARLQKLEKIYKRKGWFVKYECPTAVHTKETMLNFENKDGIGHGTASLVVESGGDSVKGIDIAKYIEDLRKKYKPKVLFGKMDIEGAEYDVLPHMEKNGLLCKENGFDIMTLEYHYRLKNQYSPNWSYPTTQLCKTKTILVDLDSEDYVKDGKPLPEFEHT